MDGQRTIARLWRDAVARWPLDDTAYLTRAGDTWHPLTWGQAAATVEVRANGLLARGIRKGDSFAILASTSLDWALTDFALAHVGAVTAPIYATSSATDVAYVLRHSGAVGVLCEDDAQRAKVEEAQASLPNLREVLTFADLPALDAEGAAYRDTHPNAVDDAVAAIGDDDLFTFIYTSGTTGPPKGCMITHRNYYDMVAVVEQMPQFVLAGDVALLYLPLAHNFGRLIHLAGPFSGFANAFEPDPYAVAAAMVAVRPTVFPSVPRAYEKMHTAIAAAFAETTGARRRLVDWALSVGRRVGALRMDGKPVPRALAVQHRVADKLVYRKVKARLGGRLRVPISGGAPLSKEIAEFFDSVDVRIYEAYGLTECTSGATANRPESYRYGTVGQALPGFELKLAPDGELLIRSSTVFAGYYGDAEATAAALDDEGWLLSGDVASIDEDGFVTITDRKKDIIVTAGGKNIAPQNIENDLKASRFISQALLIGDRRPYPTALLTLDADEIAKWARERDLDGDVAALSQDVQVRTLVQGIVDDVNAERTRFEQIKRFAVLPRDFEAERGEITPTLKLKRRACLEHFGDTVETLYADAEADPATDSG